ncbi:MAG: serine hydrolase [Calditrichaeota bacterium]|nr:MAG: serine hydrolase [Calditrichota bacterium]
MMRNRRFRLAILSLAWLVLGNCLIAMMPGFAGEKRTDTVLLGKLKTTIKDFEGDVGIYVYHIPSGREAAINADSLFPTASMIKVPILLQLFDRLEKGELSYRDEVVYKDSLYYPGADILGSFKDGEKIVLSKVVMLMITTSDNTASLWCQRMAGGGEAINQFLVENGFSGTRVNSRTPGRKEAWKKYGWGQTTPAEMATLLLQIREGTIVSRAASEEMYRVLCNIYWNGEALSQIPPWVQAASKQGAVSQSRSEVVLVNAPSGDYVFSLITKNQKDTSWEHDNTGYVLLRTVSRLLWEYFEPDSRWEPALDMSKWTK